MKYIMFRKDYPATKQSHFVPVIFSGHLVHKMIASDLRRDQLHGYVPHSAGFIHLQSMNCYGRSESLDIGNDGDYDKRRILACGSEYDIGVMEPIES